VLKDHYGVAALDPLPARFRKLLELLEHVEQHDR
jgi:hypothetical protein